MKLKIVNMLMCFVSSFCVLVLFSLLCLDGVLQSLLCLSACVCACMCVCLCVVCVVCCVCVCVCGCGCGCGCVCVWVWVWVHVSVPFPLPFPFPYHSCRNSPQNLHSETGFEHWSNRYLQCVHMYISLASRSLFYVVC